MALPVPMDPAAGRPPALPSSPQMPRWGYQASFIQPRQPAFWLFVIIVAITALLILGEQARILSAFPVAWLFSWLLLAIWVVPVVLAVYVLDQFEREPVSIMVAASLWGAVAATGLALVTNTAWFEILFKLFGATFVQTWGPALIGPTVEETLKYAGLVLIYLVARSEIDDLFDGFIYGAMIGLGFATVENVGYFIRPVVALGGADQLGPVVQLYLLRVVFSGFYMHVLWTGLTGVGLAYFVSRTDQPRQRRLLVAIGLFAAGVTSHFVWNSPLLTDLLRGNPGPLEMILFGLFKGLPFLGFLIVLILLAQRRERRWFEVATASEVEAGVLSPTDVSTLGDIRRRVAARRALQRSHGSGAGRLLGKLQREQINLAMVRTRSHDPRHPDIERQRDLVRSLKDQLAAMPTLPIVPLPTVPLPAPGSSAAAATVTPASPAPAAAPAPPTVTTNFWAPSHGVPETGMLAWSAPDPRLTPMVTLAARLDLRSVEQVGDWARVEAVNGWTGWVDARLLVRLSS